MSYPTVLIANRWYARSGWKVAMSNCRRSNTSTSSSRRREPVAAIANQTQAVVYNILFHATAERGSCARSCVAWGTLN